MLVLPPCGCPWWILLLKNGYMLVSKYVFVIFLSLFVIRNFRGTCSSIEMLKGYIGKVSLGTPDLFGSGSGRIFALPLPLPQKKDRFHRLRFQVPLPHPCWGGTVSFKAKFASVWIEWSSIHSPLNWLLSEWLLPIFPIPYHNLLLTYRYNGDSRFEKK